MTDGKGNFGEMEEQGRAHGAGWDRAEEMRAEIRARLQGEIKAEPYLETKDVASLLKLKPKTLENDRSSKKKPRWPQPIRMAGKGKVLYVRSHVIDWLVEQEIASTAIKVHRCL